jgi:hypothetical protein
MTDHLIHLPGNFRYVYQFGQGKSQYKCVEASLAMAGQIAYPSRYGNPAQLMSQIYTQYVGPDVAGDRNGTTKAQALDWLQSQHIGHIDMQPLIDAGQLDELKAQIQAQNEAGVPQLISIGDESFLHDARSGHTLHNWVDALNHGSHTMLRVGFSDDQGYGLYMEPAAAPNFAEPVAISWQNFLDGKVVGCIAIFPAGMQEYPPAPPAPVFDEEKADSTLASVFTALDAIKLALTNLRSDLNLLN